MKGKKRRPEAELSPPSQGASPLPKVPAGRAGRTGGAAFRFEGWIVAALLAIFAAQALWHARGKSATYDEPAHLAVSRLLWETGENRYDVGHPPLVRRLLGLPLVLLGSTLPAEMPPPAVSDETPLIELPGSALYYYSTAFLYANSVSAERLLFWARCVNVCLGLLLGCVLFRLAKRLGGTAAGLSALILFAFCPNLIAHSSLATTDAGGVAFALLFLLCLVRLFEGGTPGRALVCGLALGLSLLAKTTNVILAPLFLLNFFLVPAFAAPGESAPLLSRERIRQTLLVLAAAWLTLCAGYRFENVFGPHLLAGRDWSDLGWTGGIQSLYRRLPLPDAFLRGVAYNMVHENRGHGAFLLGQYSSFSWWYYFPVAFALKTPIVTLLLIPAWLLWRLRAKNRLQPVETLALTTIFVLGVFALRSKVGIGLRHILMVYPLIHVLLGGMAGSFWAGRKKRAALILAGLLLAGEGLSAAPDYLAFFNRASGGPEAGARYLSDSNIDWGQDLPGLTRFLKAEGDPELLLAYFGTALPEHYGLRYQGLPTVWEFPRSRHVNSIEPKRELLAVSVTNLQGTYFARHDLYSGWLQKKRPIAKIGHSIWVYDVTNDAEAQSRLLEIYRQTGEVEKFLRQAARLKKMQRLPG